MKSRVKNAGRCAIVLFGMCFLLLSFTQGTLFPSSANVTIPAQQEFVLGEYQNTSYKAKLNNTSNKMMEVSVVDKETGKQTQGFGLDGKGRVSVYIRKNEKVLLKNPNDKEILVRVKMSKTVEGMRYQELGISENE